MNAITIRKPVLFNFEECLWFLNRNYDDCLHIIEPGKLSKAIVVNGEPVVFSVEEDKQHLVVAILYGEEQPGVAEAVCRYVINWFDLERDLEPFYALLRKHKKLGYMATSYHGFRLISIEDVYEALCWSIIGQQINLTFAYSLKRRLVEGYGRTVEAGGRMYHLFPRPEVLSEVKVADLRPLQYSERKAEYLIALSRLFASGSLSRDHLLACESYTAQLTLLTGIRGIGIWTANYALMKSLKQMQAIPHGDVGLLNALASHELIKDRKDAAGISKVFKGFKGWESYLVFYLWRSLSPP